MRWLSALFLTITWPVAHAQSPAGRTPVPSAPAEVTAFIGVHVVPMDTKRVLANQTVLVQHGWITALGPSNTIHVPADARRIDGRGQFLIPGLGDMHVHLGSYTAPLADSAYGVATENRLFLWLSEGITTVRNMDYEAAGGWMKLQGADLLRFKARAAAGTLLSPRIYTSGPWMGTRPWGKMVPPESLAVVLAAYQAAGFDFLKLYGESPDAIMVITRRLGLPVAGHAPSLTLAPMLATGIRSIEHLTGYVVDRSSEYERFGGLRSPSDHPDTLRSWARATRHAGVWNVPTLFHNEGFLNGGPGEKTLAYHLVKAFQDAGAGLLLGTDAPHGTPRVPHHGDPGKIHEELEAFVLAGLTPYQALVAGTRNVAAYFGTLKESGTIAVGKRADLVLLYGDPLQVISNTKNPAGVMIGGRWLPRKTIDLRIHELTTAANRSP